MRILTSLIASVLIAIAPLSAETLVKSGETVAFLGDSITAGGAATPGGYVRLVESGLKANGVDIKVIPAGIGGHKSDQMLQRLPGILAQKPDWLTLSCGVNDVWHGKNGVSLEDYKTNITAIVDQCKAAGVNVVILTATQIGLPIGNDNNIKLDGYNAFLRDLAKERDLPLADLNGDMAATQETDTAAGLKRSLTTDGVHMNIYGNLMMAKGVLGAFGLTDAEIATASTAWLDVPDAYQSNIKLKLTLRELATLEELAKQQGKSADALGEQLATEAVKNAIQEVVK